MVEGIWIAGCWQKWFLPRGNRRQVGGAGGGGSSGDTGVTARPEAGRYTSGNILMNDLEDWLLIALDGKFRELRQDNHVTPSVILVFDAATGFVEAFDLMDLPPRNPCGPGERWPLQDLAPAAKEKATLY